MKFAARTDMGMSRELNEDSYNIIFNNPGVPMAFIIADGMGGHSSGEVASKMAVDTISDEILKLSEKLLKEENIPGLVNNILLKANNEVYRMSVEQEKNSGMGTTVITAVEWDRKLFISHIGDSRVYVIRDGQMQQITTDHSFVEELVKTGSLTRKEAENHPNRNIITRALGCAEDVEVDTYIYDIKENDIFIMCTDGLTNMLTESEIKNIVLNADTLEAACDELINRANSCGGEDNITVIIISNWTL